MINMTTQNVNKIWVLLANREQKEDQIGTSPILMVIRSPGDLFNNGDFDFNVLPDDVDTANMWNTLKILLERTQTMVCIASDINPMIFLFCFITDFKWYRVLMLIWKNKNYNIIYKFLNKKPINQTNGCFFQFIYPHFIIITYIYYLPRHSKFASERWSRIYKQ